MTVPRLALRKWKIKGKPIFPQTSFYDWRGRRLWRLFDALGKHPLAALFWVFLVGRRFLFFFFLWFIFQTKRRVRALRPLDALRCLEYWSAKHICNCISPFSRNLCSWCGHTVDELSASVAHAVLKCQILGCVLVGIWFFCIFCGPQECFKGRRDPSGKFPVVLW